MRVFSTDHKVIGLQYAFTSLAFLLLGFCLILLIRWQLAFPMHPIPLVGGVLGEANAPGGVMLPEFYTQLGAMHGTIMVFLAVVPLAVGAFGNYLVPLMIGAPDMAFPRLNAWSYWLYLGGGPRDARQLLPAGRRGQLRLDVVSAAGRVRHRRTDRVAGRHAAAHRVVARRIDQHHRHDPAAQRARADDDAAAVLRLDAARDVVPAAARVSRRCRRRPSSS